MVVVESNNKSSTQSAVQAFLSSLEVAYQGVEGCRNAIAAANPTTYSLVHRVHALERRATSLVERSARLHEETEEKKSLLKEILDENTKLAKQVKERSCAHEKSPSGELRG
jgi:uncharacterized protein YoxC